MSRVALKVWWLVAMLALIVAVWPADVSAVAPLTQVYVSGNGAFHFSYPSGWLHKSDRGAIVIASNDAALKGVSAGGDVVPGQIRMVIWPTRADLSQTSGASLAGKGGKEVMQLMIDGADLPPGTQVPKSATRVGDKPAWLLTTKNSQGYGALLLAVEVGGGEITAVMVETASGETAQWRATVLAIVRTMLLRTADAAPDEGKLLRQWASAAEATSEYSKDNWSATRATGAPDVEGCGDNGKAWASAKKDGRDTLTLHFDTAVLPTQIIIHQTYHPGAITAVELLLADRGATVPIPNSADPDTTCPHAFTLAVPQGIPAVDGMVIHLDQTIGGGWNEIDAVELVGRDAGIKLTRQWASSAEASSQYGDENWSAAQATGAPDVPACGDNGKAWASAKKDGLDTLTLHYDKTVTPTQVNIYQVYNPGSIVAVDLLPADGGGAVPLPDSADPDKSCPHVFRLKVQSGQAPFNGVVIHLDQTIGGSWNEIDAVELVGK
jgi:hypothetical protein